MRRAHCRNEIDRGVPLAFDLASLILGALLAAPREATGRPSAREAEGRPDSASACKSSRALRREFRAKASKSFYESCTSELDALLVVRRVRMVAASMPGK